MMHVCCVCHRVECDGKWAPAAFLSENAVVTHGYCPDCFTEVMTEIDERAAAMAAVGLTGSGWSTERGQWG